MHFDLHADVVIVGGGLAGLTCAIGLRDCGLSIALLEETETLGGRARSWVDRVSGDVIDIGPHILLSEYPNMRSLLQVLGTHDRILWQTDKLIRLVDDDESIDMYVHPLTPPLHLLPSIAKIPSLSLHDKLSNRSVTWLAMQLGEEEILEFDRLSAAELLREREVSPRFIEWFWASACMSLINVPLEECSAGALLRVYAQLISHRGYQFGFAKCGLGELYAPAALQMTTNAGGRVHMQSRVTALIEHGGAVRGVVLADGTRIAASHCVLAVPPQVVAQLLPAAMAEQHGFGASTAFEPCPYISVYLWLDRKLSIEKFWYRLWRPENLNSDFYDLSNIRCGWSERPSVIASNIIYSHRANDMSDAEIVSGTMRELMQAMPTAEGAAVLHSVVNRIAMAIPCPAPGSESRRPETRTAIPGLLLAGDWTRTQLPACMESAVRSGWLAAEQIWDAVGQPRELARSMQPPQGLAGLVQRHSQRAPPVPSPLPDDGQGESCL
ncbi:MAG: hydroxysqualene dehydroxylase [Steroidobacter sp.]